MMEAQRNHQDWDPTAPLAGAGGYERRPRIRRRALGIFAAVAMLGTLGFGQATPPAHAAQQEDTGTPGPTATAEQWESWSQDLFAEAHSTDWAADSAKRGCELISVDIVSTTVPEGTWEGAPEGLTVPVVNRTEDCSGGAGGSAAANVPSLDAHAARSGGCASTAGPGTVCLSRSASYLTASFTYRGSGSPDGFIRIYDRNTSSGCGTGATLATSSTATYSPGETHSVTGYAPGHGPYSATFWHDLWLGSSNWGTVCRTL